MSDKIENTEYVSHMKRNARATTKTNWFMKWNTKRKGKYEESLFKTKRRQIDKFSKSTASRITQLRTQHGHMNAYLYEINVINSSRCSCEALTQNTEHFLLHCRKYITQRKVLQEKLKQRLSVHAILYTTRGIEALKEFLETTDVCVRPNTQQNADMNLGWGNLSDEQN